MTTSNPSGRRPPRAALLLALLAAGAGGGCALFPQNIAPPDSVFSDAGLTGPAGSTGANDSAQLMVMLERDVVSAWTAMQASNPVNEAALSNTLLVRGISLVDARCDRYFKALGRAAQKQGFAQRELGLTAGLVGTLQGLTAVAARDIALTAGGLGFLGASSSAYADAFIFSPEVSAVQALVGEAQKSAKDRIESMPVADMSRGAAINLLQDYEKTCEVHTIRRLVNESLSSAKPVASFTADDPQTANAMSPALRMAVQDVLAALLQVDVVTDEQMLALYWLSYKSAAVAPADVALQVKKLAGFPVLVDTAAGRLKEDAAAQKARRDVARALRPLVLVASARLDADLAALRQPAAAPAVAPAVAGGPAAAPGGPSMAPPPGGGAAAAAPAATGRRGFAPSLTVRVPSGTR